MDRDNDLAILRVDGNKQDLPPPLPVDTSAGLTELQNVYIFGYPFGENLGKNITISSSAVSSIRKDTDGAVSQVQVNGGMHPGNSGGPIVDSRGVVIGVSVAIITGTQINFVVPGEKVLGLLRGRGYHDPGRSLSKRIARQVAHRAGVARSAESTAECEDGDLDREPWTGAACGA